MFSRNTSESLQKKSADILGVFTKTVTSLQEVNSKAQAQSTANREEAKALLTEAESLDAVVASNSKVIGKISSILND